MSQKVHPKSLRLNRWHATNQRFFAESPQYADTLGRAWSYPSLICQRLNQHKKHRIMKAPSKRRLKKSAFYMSNVCVRAFHTQWQVSPILFTWPQKGFAQKYLPTQVAQKKRFTLAKRRNL